jgi:hypothetical protein
MVAFFFLSLTISMPFHLFYKKKFEESHFDQLRVKTTAILLKPFIILIDYCAIIVALNIRK